ncbi:YsnF/AvaK domain-containing protein [Clostridium folliculivorans]|uniref:DUF2382 domain-containing protein n=1 Tax=Clostridium folliculivorans TaxID=2886038 RepID=A0A9W6DA29_9CLOT|nr:YsnF/AvaK domain-containing protein [Clostridium folliculivorans]GKU24960.1 hypothetical protein CFOLD11_17860 [Clostridium folliculivorans]GKU31058.1 hypothetical protein CFB3_31650 [Clostridium folliculivorans]
MGIFSGLFGDDENTSSKATSSAAGNTKQDKNDARVELRKEEINVSKNKVQKGEVELGKEIVEDHKCMDVPVSHEEVVIDRKTLNNQVCDTPIKEQQSIRIPVSEERVDVTKNTVVTGEVTAHKREVQQTQHIEQTLKHEEPTINKVGNPVIVDNQNNQQQ